MKKYKVTFRDGSSVIVPNKQSVEDERLSPMTYKKLKEMGYTSEKWKNLTQEQANKIIQQGNKQNSVTKSKNQEQSKMSEKNYPRKVAFKVDPKFKVNKTKDLVPDKRKNVYVPGIGNQYSWNGTEEFVDMWLHDEDFNEWFNYAPANDPRVEKMQQRLIKRYKQLTGYDGEDDGEGGKYLIDYDWTPAMSASDMDELVKIYKEYKNEQDDSTEEDLE